MIITQEAGNKLNQIKTNILVSKSDNEIDIF